MKKGKIDFYKKIEIPHLRFNVYFMDLSKLQGVPKLGAGYTCIFEDNSATVFLQDIEKNVKRIEFTPYIAHEIMHVIQIICEKFSMRVEIEQEHTAYIMHYLMDKLINK